MKPVRFFPEPKKPANDQITMSMVDFLETYGRLLKKYRDRTSPIRSKYYQYREAFTVFENNSKALAEEAVSRHNDKCDELRRAWTNARLAEWLSAPWRFWRKLSPFRTHQFYRYYQKSVLAVALEYGLVSTTLSVREREVLTTLGVSQKAAFEDVRLTFLNKRRNVWYEKVPGPFGRLAANDLGHRALANEGWESLASFYWEVKKSHDLITKVFDGDLATVIASQTMITFPTSRVALAPLEDLFCDLVDDETPVPDPFPT